MTYNVFGWTLKLTKLQLDEAYSSILNSNISDMHLSLQMSP